MESALSNPRATYGVNNFWINGERYADDDSVNFARKVTASEGPKDKDKLIDEIEN